MSLSPFVYWAQTETHIYLRADLNNIKNHEVVADIGIYCTDSCLHYTRYFNSKVCIEEEEVELTAIASGAHGEDCRCVFTIHVQLPLFTEIAKFLQ